MKKFARVLALMLVAVMLCAILAACGATPASDPKEAAKALKENEYTIITETDSMVMAQKDDDYIAIYYFETEELAEAAYEAIEKEAEGEEDAVYGIDGKMVWAATSDDAVSAAS